MTFLKLIPLLFYGWFFARFLLRLLEPKFPGSVIGGIYILYGLLYIVFDRYLSGFAFTSLCMHIGFLIIALLLFRGGIVKTTAICAIGYACYNFCSYLASVLFYLTIGLPEWVTVLAERSRFIAAIALMEIICRKCERLGGVLPLNISASILLPVLFVVVANEYISYAYRQLGVFRLEAVLRDNALLPVHYVLDELAVGVSAALGVAVLLVTVFGGNSTQESRLREQQLAMQVEHYKLLGQQHKAFMALRHDVKNHILSLQGLLSHGENCEAAKYLTRMAESAAIAEPVIATGNSAVDAVLNEKYRQAITKGIVFECDALIPIHSRLDSFDLCVILGNALDNAIEACGECEQNRVVKVKAGTVKSFLVLEVRNTTIMRELNTKASKPGHGTGIKNIRAVTERLGGTVSISLVNSMFVLSVLLPV